MEIYLLKSAACLAAFFVFYKIFLERENMHVLKRIYLLISLIGAIVIPLITFTEYVEIPKLLNSFNYNVDNNIVAEVIEEPTNYLLIILGSIYVFGVLFFSIKFGKNLFDLFRKVKNNLIISQNGFKNVLLTLKVVPHTFFSYIFLNKRKFENNEIPQEVLLHEQAHAKQRHSLDVLFIELVQIVFWFNPLIFFFKKAIKLNHEFLADQAVLKNGVETSNYQKILLAFSSSAQTPILANSINYSSIKKRFTVMKTQTSRKAIWLRTALLLPLLALLIYGFSTTQTIYTENTSEESLPKNLGIIENITIQLRDDKIAFVNDLPASLKTFPELLNKFNRNLSKKEKNDLVKITIESSKPIRMSLVYEITTILKEYGVTKIYVPGSIFDDTTKNGKVLKTSDSGIDIYAESTENDNINFEQTKATKEEMAEYKGLVKKLYATKMIKQKDVARINEIYYKKMSPDQQEANPLPKLPPPPPPPVSQMVMKGEKSSIPLPPPPPPPSANGPNHGIYVFVSGETIYVNGKLTKVQNFKDAINKVTSDWPEKYYKVWGVQINTENVDDDFINKINNEYRKTNIGKRSKKNVRFIPMKAQNIPPPPPPPPMPPLEYIKELANDGATFYLDDKKITSDKAIEFVTSNKTFCLNTDVENSKPVVRLARGEKKSISNSTSNQASKQSAIYYYSVPEAPPAPMANKVEYLKALSKKGATFYIGPHKYSLEEAIKMVEKSDTATIDVSKYPEVHIGGC